MEQYNSEEQLKKIIKVFEKTDEFYNAFRIQFVEEQYLIINKFFPIQQKSEELESDLLLYAEETLSSVETVFYKDKSYSDSRIEEELAIMTRIVVKEPDKGHNVKFIEETHLKAKEIIFQHYPDIIDLSGNGLRLLEKNTKMYNWEFIVAFYTSLNNQ